MLFDQSNPSYRPPMDRQRWRRSIPVISSGIAVSLALALGAAHGALAGEAPHETSTAAPISVGGCGVTSGKYPWFWTRFTNTTPVAADEVVFRVQYGDQQRTINDKGLFSRDVSILHQFRTAFANGFRSATCKIVRVHYVDGTTSGPQD